MKKRFHLTLTIAAIAGAALMIACDQIDEANALINASNQKVLEAQKIFEKANADSDVLLAGEVDDLKTKNQAKAKETIAAYEKAGEMFKAAAKDFDDAGKLKLSDKLKTYVGLKSKQLVKTGEYVASLKDGLQVLMSASVEDMEKKMNDYKTKNEALSKEVDDLAAQVKKFEDENKDIIK